ncbi:MAG: armadillo-type protein, partial [Olpidium bornovanus]
MQGQEIGGAPVRIGFAKVPPAAIAANGHSASPGRTDISPTCGRHRQSLSAVHFAGLQDGNVDGTSPARGGFPDSSPNCSDALAVAIVSPWSVWGNIGEDDPEDESDEKIVIRATNLLREAAKLEETASDKKVLHFAYASTVPPAPEPNRHRKVDQPRLRELRKLLDSPQATAKEIEAAFDECYDDCVDLCSDYIGNTVVQKFVERCNGELKLRLVRKVAPHLAAVGVHKNGTWAVQKIIDSARTDDELREIAGALRQYTPPLLLDQFGNYVVQCCLRVGPRYNQFVFDAIYVRCCDIAQGRFGARAIRTCLESQYTTRKQQVMSRENGTAERRGFGAPLCSPAKLVAIAIIENALQLAVNPNGSILLTWLLD